MTLPYCVRADVEAIFGVNNVDEWADLDDNDNAADITARIIAGIVSVDDEIDSFMRSGPYPLPLENDDGSTPKLVRDISATLAGVWLHSARGVVEMSSDGKAISRLAVKDKWAWKKLSMLKKGAFRIDNKNIQNMSPKVIS